MKRVLFVLALAASIGVASAQEKKDCCKKTAEAAKKECCKKERACCAAPGKAKAAVQAKPTAVKKG